MNKLVDLPIVWDSKYERLGVTPRELYMRQNNLCWLRPEIMSDGKVIIFCTDGKDKAETSKMLNPTHECARCMINFTTKSIQDSLNGLKPKIEE